jgi:peptide deformylase
MAIRTILTLDKPVLRTKAKKVSRFDSYLQRLVDDMWETMRAAPGVGLAAPQVGESIRVLVAEYEDQAVALVNPEIIKRSDDEVLGTEGCLSIPGVVGDDVPRARAVTVKARDPRGKEIRVKAEDWFARVLQHEIDHLDGVLFIDRIPKENVRRVEEDELIEEGEVEKVTTGKNGKKQKQPERNERPATASPSLPGKGPGVRSATTSSSSRPSSPPHSASSASTAVQSSSPAESATAGSTRGGGR